MPLLEIYQNPLRGIWKITESSAELISLFAENEYNLSDLESLKKEKRKQEWLAARLLLKELLGYLPLIIYNEAGAPRLPYEKYSISISHTEGYVAVLLQEKPFVGIDIERRTDRICKIANRFMSDKELAAIDSDHLSDHLLIYWCAKEALFKLVGRTGVDFRSHLFIEPFSLSCSGSLNVWDTLEGKRYFFIYKVYKEYILVFSDPSI